MKASFIALLIAASLGPAAADPEKERAREEGMRETLQARIEEASVIVDISIYEQEWIKPDADFWKGRLIQRAIVTHVHTGKVPLGTRLEFTHLIEDSPKFLNNFRSTVEGELKTLLFDDGDIASFTNGKVKLDGDGHWGFQRVNDTFAELFLQELKSNPKLKTP